MSAGWVAGSARARLLLGRRLGGGPALDMAAAGSVAEAFGALAASPYGNADLGVDVASAQRAIAATTLLRLRVLAGWLPPGAVAVVRSLAGWFEVANVEDRLAYLLGHEPRPPFELGSLSLAWPALAQAQTPGALRDALAASPWGDPGDDEPAAVHVSLRVAWARRVLAEVPEARAWVRGGLALLLARGLVPGGGVRPPAALDALLGSAWRRAHTVRALAAALPADAAWALEGVEDPHDLWRAEMRWWARVERDAGEMVRDHREGRQTVVGAVVLLGADARRAGAALEAAARGGHDLVEEVLGAAD